MVYPLTPFGKRNSPEEPTCFGPNWPANRLALHIDPFGPALHIVPTRQTAILIRVQVSVVGPANGG